MKVSNNALNFLLAQYRAIFKRAYVKGLASAVLLTAGLAAGASQAQAANLTNDSGSALEATEAITIGSGGDYDSIKISGGFSNKWNADVTITSGAASSTGNYILGSGGTGDLAITGTGSLTIAVTEATASGNGLAIIGDGSGSSLSIKDVTVQRGEIKILDSGSNSSGTALLAADTIMIGRAAGEEATTTREAYLTVKADTTKGATLGAAGSNITIDSTGQLTLTGATSATSKVTGASLTVKEGGLLLINGAGTNTIEATDLNIEAGAFGVISGGASGAFAGETATVAGNLLVNGTLDINTTPATGTVTLADGSNTVISGTVNVNSGTVVVANSAALNAASTSTKLNVSNADTTLVISSDALDSFINGGQKYTAINENVTLGTANGATGVSGGVYLSGSTLTFSDTTQVNLSEINFESGSAAASGKVVFNSGSTTNITGESFLITDQFSGMTGTGSKIVLKANTLSLGGESAVDDYGFSGAYVRNLYNTSSAGAISLGNTITLDVTLGDSTANIADENGVIQGDFILDDSTNGKLTAEHGTFTYNEGTLTLSGGTLTVKNGALTGEQGNIDTVLTLNNTLDITNKAGTIEVDGTGQGDAATILDLSKVTLKFVNGDSANLAVNAKAGGVIKIQGADLAEMVNPTLTSGAKVFVSGGTLQVEGDLALDATKLTSGTAAGSTGSTIVLSNAADSFVEVNGTLTLDKVSELDLSDHGYVTADELELNVTDTAATSATLKSGKFTAWSGLSSNSTKGVNVSGATLLLGGFDGVEGSLVAKSNGGNIKTDLTLKDGNVTIQNGSWKGANQTITVDAGNFKVGDATQHGASGSTFDTSLTVNKLALNGGKTLIDTVGSVTVNDLTASGAALEINGSMTVNGLAVAAGAKDPNYGVHLAAGAIDLGENADLTFKANAVKAITVNTSNVSGSGWISFAKGTFGSDTKPAAGETVITSNVGSTVTFEFDSGTSFGSEALAEFRKEIFGVAAGGNLAGFVNLGDAQIAGLTDAIKNNEIAYDDLKGYIDVNSDFTTEALQSVKVTGIDSSSELRGSLGSLSSTELSAGEQITVNGSLALNNAAANGGKFAANAAGEVLGLDVTENVQVNLNNGGEVGTVSFSNKGGSFVVDSENGTTKIAAIDGAYATTNFTTGTTTVTGTTETSQLTTAAGTNTTFGGAVTVGQRAAAGTTSTLAGDTTFQAAATFAQNAVVANTGSADFAGDVTFEGTASLYGDTTVDGTATAEQGLTVDQGAEVAINKLVTEGKVLVGSVSTNAGHKGAAGNLSVTTLNLGGQDLVVDPDWNNASGLSFAGVDNFTADNTVHTDAGVLNGSAYALQNAILSIGNNNKDEVTAIFGKFINAQGNLSNDKDGVGAIVYVADTVEVAANGKIVADKTNNQNTYGSATYVTHGAFIGDNSVLGVEVSAANGYEADGVTPKAAITFADQATISSSKTGKILLTGDYDQSDSITLFDDIDGNITVSGDAITVETINGLLTYKYDGSALSFDISDMTVDTKRAASAFSATSSPVHESLVAYGTGDTAWDDPKAYKEATKTHGAAVSGIVLFNGKFYYESEVEGQDPTVQVDPELAEQLTTVAVANPAYDPEDQSAGAAPQYLTQVVYKAYNPLLSAINNVQANSGISAESAARMADFAGVAQVALKAGNSTSDAISGRMGMGAQNSAITYANNGQGAGLWVTPIYMNSDSDGFEAQGISYGTDINLYGVALGGDYTLANGIRVGAMFNVGSGDVDGQGAGSNVSSDFDYYGLGLYAGYTMGQFSIVGDISYTAVDNDLEANTEFADIGKLETSLDSSNISLGVTGAYAFDTAAGVTVTPHVGLRYSYIDIDDYTVDSKVGAIGSYSADSLSVFSIPVGVTIASEFNAGSWSVKPSFDVTLTGNFGDDENEGTFHWDGVENIDCGLTSEIFDNFTYGATLGVAAQSASGISLGLSVGYTGSSNVDDFGVNANARFTF